MCAMSLLAGGMFGQNSSARVKFLAVVMGASGLILMLAAALYISAGPNVLAFLLDGFDVIPIPTVDIGIFVVILGAAMIPAAVGIWRLYRWAFVLGISISIVEILIGLLAGQYTSFEFIRGAVVMLWLNGTRHLFFPVSKGAENLPSRAVE